jgi:hypothetical protein
MARSRRVDASARPEPVAARASVPTPVVFVAEGYAVPRAFVAHDELADGTAVDIDVEIEEKRAIARRVVLANDGGVSSTALRKVTIRDTIATGCLARLQQAKVQPDSTVEWVAANPADAEVRKVVQRLVRYVGTVEWQGQEVTASVRPADEKERSR